MSRTEIFTKKAIQGLLSNQPYLKLFQKDDWEEYLQLIVLIYDLLEDRVSKVEFAQVESVLENFYYAKPPSFVISKKASFMTMAIAELELLRDSHDALGNRWIEATREGKQLLKLCEGWIKQRKQFTGTGADTLMGSLNQMLQDQQSLTQEEALASHQAVIQKYKKDMDRIKIHGVQASELLISAVTLEELFSRADEAASHILAAGEDIKLSIEEVRKNLAKRYHDQDFSAGQAIEFVADFHKKLRESAEYLSFTRAKDILSYVEGLGGHYPVKDIHQILHQLTQRKKLSEEELKKSNLPQFPRSFHGIIQNIEEKVQEQLRLLRIQVNYVMAGGSKKSRADLKDLMGLVLQNEGSATEFATQAALAISERLPLHFGPLALHSMERPERVDGQTLEQNFLEDHEQAALANALQQAEETTVRKVVDKLRVELSRQGELRLSEYEITDGILEAYVLTRLEYFADEIGSDLIPGKVFNLSFRGTGSQRHQKIQMKEMQDRIFRLT